MFVKITVDAEGKRLIDSLCDVALKSGGLQNITGVSKILTNTTIITPDKKSDKVASTKTNNQEVTSC